MVGPTNALVKPMQSAAAHADSWWLLRAVVNMEGMNGWRCRLNKRLPSAWRKNSSDNGTITSQVQRCCAKERTLAIRGSCFHTVSWRDVK